MSWHEEKTAHSLGQLGGASLSNCRELRAEGVNAKLGCNLSENTTSCQNEIVSQGTDANEAARRRFNAYDTADSRREFFSLIVRTFRRRRPQKRAPVIFRG